LELRARAALHLLRARTLRARFAPSRGATYTCIVTRTQIYLSDSEAAALDRESQLSGRTKSQLIREAIDAVYLKTADATTLERALKASAGAWKRRETGAAYVDRVRGGTLARASGTRG